MKKIYSIEDALTIDAKETFSLNKEHINPSLANMLSLLNFDKQFIKAEGTKVWDSEGNEYLDFLGGYGALNFGHNNKYIIDAIEKVNKFPNILQASMGTMASVLAHNLAQITPGDLNKVFLCNSGAEAVEGSLKLARISTGKSKFIYCNNSFHGKSFGALSVTGREKYQKYFQPLLPGCVGIPYGDLEALENQLKNKDTAAFILEPIQGEGGIIVPPKGYIKKAKELCEKYETLMILDEVQTGFGRTGTNFACEYEDVVPDILSLAKSLGGGILPVGAYITSDKVWNNAYGSVEKALLHTSTFGGNTLSSAVGIASIEVLVNEKIAQQAKEKGEYLLNKLLSFKSKYKIVKDIRGRGLMVGIEFEQPSTGFFNKITGGLVNKLSNEYMGSLIAGELQNKARIITAYTLNNPNVIRLEPPLTVSYDELDYLVDSLENIFSKHKGFSSIAMSSGKEIINNIFKK